MLILPFRGNGRPEEVSNYLVDWCVFSNHELTLQTNEALTVQDGMRFIQDKISGLHSNIVSLSIVTDNFQRPCSSCVSFKSSTSQRSRLTRITYHGSSTSFTRTKEDMMFRKGGHLLGLRSHITGTLLMPYLIYVDNGRTDLLWHRTTRFKNQPVQIREGKKESCHKSWLTRGSLST
jgi:hypothetical protein